MPEPEATTTATTETTATPEGEKKPRKPRPERVAYLVEGAEPLKALPEDWNGKKHLPLGKKDFADESLYFEWKSAQAQKQANKWARMARECREEGTPEQRKQKKRFAKLQEQMEAMQKELAGSLGEDGLAQFMARLQQQAAG